MDHPFYLSIYSIKKSSAETVHGPRISTEHENMIFCVRLNCSVESVSCPKVFCKLYVNGSLIFS
jgi:hypothetical protein